MTLIKNFLLVGLTLSAEATFAQRDQFWECRGTYTDDKNHRRHFDIDLVLENASEVRATLAGEPENLHFSTSKLAWSHGANRGVPRRDSKIYYRIFDVSAGSMEAHSEHLNLAGVNLRDIESIDVIINLQGGAIRHQDGLGWYPADLVIVQTDQTEYRPQTKSLCVTDLIP